MASRPLYTELYRSAPPGTSARTLAAAASGSGSINKRRMCSCSSSADLFAPPPAGMTSTISVTMGLKASTLRDHESTGRPASSMNCLRMPLPMRVPLPAARRMAVTRGGHSLLSEFPAFSGFPAFPGFSESRGFSAFSLLSLFSIFSLKSVSLLISALFPFARNYCSMCPHIS